MHTAAAAAAAAAAERGSEGEFVTVEIEAY
jgi:hypothetical protein